MIALCRAKCCIIQLRDDDYDSKFLPRSTLPPSINDIITPICVIFIGSSPPRTRVVAEEGEPTRSPEGEGQPAETLLPFHVQHIIDSTTSTYVPGSAAPPPTAESPSFPDLTEFQNVVVTDVNGSAPSNDPRAAALKHMHKSGSNYIELPHDRKPANEFKNPTLFPMMFPTLFPLRPRWP
ncbi:hypothetical protein DFH09DRAFT_1246733 [Mycena vulgaris]|nr:hypothetical protein DFH09DRAFT_1246733 [Mycena vulgaris]